MLSFGAQERLLTICCLFLHVVLWILTTVHSTSSHFGAMDQSSLISEVNSALGGITSTLSHISSKLDQIDTRVTRLEAQDLVYSGPSVGQQQSEFASGGPSPADFAESSTAGDDIQGRFYSIKDSLQKVCLPPEYKLNESRQGIKKAELSTFNVLSKSARYVETTLRLLGTVTDQRPPSRTDLDNLLSIQIAHIKFLQEEYAATLVQSQCTDNISKWYRAIAKNTSTFSPGVCERIKTAAELSKATAQQEENRGGYRGRGNYRGRGYSFRNRNLTSQHDPMNKFIRPMSSQRFPSPGHHENDS